jgi:hypothetical protein
MTLSQSFRTARGQGGIHFTNSRFLLSTESYNASATRKFAYLAAKDGYNHE